MPKHTGIILLEGADAAGKTSLATYYRVNHGARYIHGGLYADPLKWHTAAIRRASRLAAQGDLVVIDRNWPSHLIYGAVFNNQKYDAPARDLDAALQHARALYILCVPSDPLRQEADWRAGAADGKTEHFRSVREVIALYLDLAYGNVARPGDGYLGEMIRYGDFAERRDVLLYDRYAWEGPARQARFAKKALRYLQLLRSL